MIPPLMPPLMPAPIYKEVIIAAPPERVWPLISTTEGLRRWWGASIELEAKAGGRCEERGAVDGRPYMLRGVVSTWEPPRRIVLSLQHVAGAAMPIDSTIAIELRQVDAGTRVLVTHHLHEPAFVSGVVVSAEQPPGKPPVSPQMDLSRASASYTATGAIAANRAAPWLQAWTYQWQRRVQRLVEAGQNVDDGA